MINKKDNKARNSIIMSCLPRILENNLAVDLSLFFNKHDQDNGVLDEKQFRMCSHISVKLKEYLDHPIIIEPFQINDFRHDHL